MNFKQLLFCAAAFGAASSYALSIQESGGYFESAYVTWAPVSGASSYKVLCDGTQIDDPLIRSYGSYVRADIPGLSAGSHSIKVIPVISGSEGSSATATVSVKSHDRTGFAFNNSRIPGAYKKDGTLKSGAVVLYVTEKTKDSVTLDVVTNSKGSTKTCKSFQGILNCYKKGYDTRPLDMRFIGNVTVSDSLQAGDMLIDLGNSDSASVTIEGIGSDAVANGWGIRIKNAQNVEIRNMGIMNVSSSEGDNIGLQQSNAYVWVHHNDFFYGEAGSDNDQAKGDGALDCKKSSYVTFSYNHFWDNGKSNLLGLSEGVYSYNTTDYYITYHHNWYDHSDSRHPRVRYYNAHVYNNYYDGNAKYGAGSTQGSSVFMEGNYFRNTKYPMLTSMQGTDLYAGSNKSSTDNATFSKEDGGTIKAYNNYMTGTYTFIPYGASSYVNKGSSVTASSMGIDTKTHFDAVVVSSAKETVPNTIKSAQGSHYYSNFDTDSDVMYSYTAESPEAAKETVIAYAGRMQGGDFSYTFDNSTADASYSIDTNLKKALEAYTSSIQAIQGEGSFPAVITSSSSTAQSSSSSSVTTPSSSSGKVSSSSTTPSSSSGKISSSSEASSSSSSVAISSSSENVQPSSSSAAPSLLPISSDIAHSFTADGLTSDYFGFVGNLSTDKGTLELLGDTLTRVLKMESSTQISFKLETSATLTLYFGADFNGKVKVDGEAKTAASGVLTVELDSGTHTITKGDAANLYYIDVQVESTALRQAVKAPAVSFRMESDRLSVQASTVKFIELLSAQGKLCRRSVGAREISLANLPNGIYLVRAKTGAGMLRAKIFKK